MGDAVLGQVASRLRQGGEAFRLGGDEFAVLLPGHGEREASAVARSIVERIAALRIEGIDEVTVSGGVATYPTHGAGRDELIRLADSALYWAKEDGKNRVRAYAAESFLRDNLEQLADSPDRAARYRAAEPRADGRCARCVQRPALAAVGEYAARIARRLGADEPTIELIRLGGNLHDLGKLAIPEELLRKPTTLSDGERLVLDAIHRLATGCSRASASMQWRSASSITTNGGTARAIRASSPASRFRLAARIVFVADAYDAMTASAARSAGTACRAPRRRRSRSSSAARARSSIRASSRRSPRAQRSGRELRSRPLNGGIRGPEARFRPAPC